jgi:hypothetical protein
VDTTGKPGSRAAGATSASAEGNGHRDGSDMFNAADPGGDDAAAPPPTDDGKVDMAGRQPGDEGYNIFNTKSVNAKHRAQREADEAQQAVTEKRLKRWGSRRYALTLLDGITEPWARKIAADIARWNAGRDPTRDMPQLIFSGDKAVNAGATDAQIKALPELTFDQIGALRIEAAAMLEATRTQVRERGRQITAAAGVAGYADITTRVDLSTYAPPDDPWAVDGLIPLGKSMGLFSERKAGKTTAIVDLARSLVTGGKFFGRLATRLPADADVVLLDTEMGADMMHYEFSTAGVSDPAALRRINYHDLFGRSAMLDMRNDATRAYWRDQIRPGSFIILDCLYTVLSALGVDESSSQVADVIEGFKALAVERAAAGLVIVHHLGKDPDKGARGHSSIEGSVDTLATIRLEGPPAADTPRTFEAFGRRGVNVPPARLMLDEDHRLTLSASTPSADRAKAADRKDDDIVWKLVKDNPGKSARAPEDLPIETRHNVSRSRLRRSVDRLAGLGYVVNKGTETRPAWHAADRDGDPFADPLADPQTSATECADCADGAD